MQWFYWSIKHILVLSIFTDSFSDWMLLFYFSFQLHIIFPWSSNPAIKPNHWLKGSTWYWDCIKLGKPTTSSIHFQHHLFFFRLVSISVPLSTKHTLHVDSHQWLGSLLSQAHRQIHTNNVIDILSHTLQTNKPNYWKIQENIPI